MNPPTYNELADDNQALREDLKNHRRVMTSYRLEVDETWWLMRWAVVLAFALGWLAGIGWAGLR